MSKLCKKAIALVLSLALIGAMIPALNLKAEGSGKPQVVYNIPDVTVAAVDIMRTVFEGNFIPDMVEQFGFIGSEVTENTFYEFTLIKDGIFAYKTDWWTADAPYDYSEIEGLETDAGKFADASSLVLDVDPMEKYLADFNPNPTDEMLKAAKDESWIIRVYPYSGQVKVSYTLGRISGYSEEDLVEHEVLFDENDAQAVTIGGKAFAPTYYTDVNGAYYDSKGTEYYADEVTVAYDLEVPHSELTMKVSDGFVNGNAGVKTFAIEDNYYDSETPVTHSVQWYAVGRLGNLPAYAVMTEKPAGVDVSINEEEKTLTITYDGTNVINQTFGGLNKYSYYVAVEGVGTFLGNDFTSRVSPLYAKKMIRFNQRGGGADVTDPTTNDFATAFEMDMEDVIKACLTDEEYEAYLEGADVALQLTAKKCLKNELSEDELNELSNVMKDKEAGEGFYSDVNIWLSVEGFADRYATDLNQPVKYSMELPDGFMDKVNELENGTVKVVRLHDGIASEVPCEVKDGKVIVESDGFSTFWVTYVNEKPTKPAKSDVDPDKTKAGTDDSKISPRTAPATMDAGFMMWIVLGVTAFAVFGTVAYKRKKDI